MKHFTLQSGSSSNSTSSRKTFFITFRCMTKSRTNWDIWSGDTCADWTWTWGRRARRGRGSRERTPRAAAISELGSSFLLNIRDGPAVVHMLDGNLKIGARVRSNLDYFICLRHLIRSRTVPNRILLFEKDISSCVRNIFHVTIQCKYHARLWLRHNGLMFQSSSCQSIGPT